MPEIVRVTFEVTTHGRGPHSITVYGLRAPVSPVSAAPATQLNINLVANGDDALKTVARWEQLIREAGRRNGARDADIRVGNVNSYFPNRPR
jgi:hypothetical protein